jgi:hypothetical protein
MVVLVEVYLWCLIFNRILPAQRQAKAGARKAISDQFLTKAIPGLSSLANVPAYAALWIGESSRNHGLLTNLSTALTPSWPCGHPRGDV